MPHTSGQKKKEVGKFIFFDNKKAPQSIDRFGFNIVIVVLKEVMPQRKGILF